MFNRRRLTKREALMLQAESARNRRLVIRVRELEARCRHLEKNQKSPRDAKTGVLTLEYFAKEAEKLLRARHRRAKERGQGLGLVMIDLDHFKEVNDTFGHLAGDKVLRAFGEITEKHLRENDLVCRCNEGGDEFMILLQEVAHADVPAIIEKLRQKFEQVPFPFYRRTVKAPRIRPSFSFGVAYCKNSKDSLEKMSARADKLLYKEKKARKSSR